MMKTQGEIEAAICDGITRFEQEYRGRGPKSTHAYLLGDFIVVRLQGLLTSAEQQLAKCPSEKGRDLVKQVRTHLIETAKPLMQALVQGITGVQVVSLHHDISTVTGEAFVILTLAEPPTFRQANQNERRSHSGQKLNGEASDNCNSSGNAVIPLVDLPTDTTQANAEDRTRLLPPNHKSRRG